MKKLGFSFVLIFFCIVISGCNSNENPLAYQTDTHGRGKTDILIEESFKRLFDTSIYTFESQFPKADIVPTYGTENEIIDAFFKNKAKTIIISRDLTELEIKQLKAKKVEVRSNKIATDAIALIVHPSNNDTVFTVQEIKNILNGKQKSWKSSKLPLNVVFDNINSANYNYLNQYSDRKTSQKNIFAVKSNEEVINYVKNHPSALGVIGLNWISDQDDFDVKDFLEGIKVIGLKEKENSDIFQPYAGFIYTKEYPLYRDIWVINKGKRSGLNSGFVNFMIRETGQMLIQQSGLVPANAPVRLIQFEAE